MEDLDFDHIPTANVILPPNADWSTLPVNKVAVQVEQRIAYGDAQHRGLLSGGSDAFDGSVAGVHHQMATHRGHQLECGLIFPIGLHKGLELIVDHEQVLKEYRLSIGGSKPLNVEQQRIIPTAPEGFFIFPDGDDFPLQYPCPGGHAVFPAGPGEADCLVADREFPVDAGRAYEGAPTLLFDEIALTAKLLHRPADRDTADGVFRTEFGFRGDLFFGFIFAVFDGGFDIIFDLLIERDKGVFGHVRLLFAAKRYFTAYRYRHYRIL